MERPYDVAIVGSGLVGLATARAILLRRPNARVVTVDKEYRVGAHQSSHNSGVVHAGLYYRPGSLKAVLCREGRAALLQFAEEHGIDFRRTGKLVLAVREAELDPLLELRSRAAANGLENVRMVEADEIQEFEPHMAGIRGMYVPETSVIDFETVTHAYAADVVARGGVLALGCEIVSIEQRERICILETTRRKIRADRAVICAGLQSDRLAQLVSFEPREYRIVPFRGSFLRLSPRAAKLVRGLVYPVPDPTFPFLGVHFTRRLNGEVWAGPNAVPALAREHYGRFGFKLRDAADVVGFPGTWRLARRYLRTGAREVLRDHVMRTALRDMRRYLPQLTMRDVSRGPCGIRAQLLVRDGTLVDDFVLEQRGRVLSVVNAPSPAATASLAIGARIAARLDQEPE